MTTSISMTLDDSNASELHLHSADRDEIDSILPDLEWIDMQHYYRATTNIGNLEITFYTRDRS